MANYFECPPAVEVIGERYGILHKAKNKKKMVYGSANGPLPVERKPRKHKKKIRRKPYVVNMSKGDGPIGNTD